jgi:hypothetical protein
MTSCLNFNSKILTHWKSRMHHFDVEKRLKAMQICQLFVHVHTIGIQLWSNLHNRGSFIHYFKFFLKIVVLGIGCKLILFNTFHLRFVLPFIFTWGYWKATIDEPFVVKWTWWKSSNFISEMYTSKHLMWSLFIYS